MFDFSDLDCIDADQALPEWLRWQRESSASAGAKQPQAVLEDGREELYAAPDEEEDEYVYEKLEVPFLPEQGAFDPMGLVDDSMDGVEDRMAYYNGKVVMNFITSYYEQHMNTEYQKEERRAYIDELFNQRMAALEVMGSKHLESLHPPGVKFDRKPFSWRDLHTPLCGAIAGLPDGGALAERPWDSNAKLINSLTKVRGTVFLPTSTMVQILCCMAHFTRPAPTGPKIRSNTPWHIAITDLFFPSPLVVDDGSEYIGKNEEAPAIVHLVAISVHKETGEINAKNLLENIKFHGSTKYPKH